MSYATIDPVDGTPPDIHALDRIWIDQALARVDSQLRQFFDVRTADAGSYGPTYRRLWEQARDACRGGKRVRPRLVLTAYRGFGGAHIDPPMVAVLAVAVAYELLHAAFLLHDDVIDGDTVRRGRPNVSGAFRADALDRGASAQSARRWGEVGAILAGDLLLHATAGEVARVDVDAVVRGRLLEILDHSVFVTAAGELADVSLECGLRAEAPALDDVLAVTERKTSAYSVSGPLMSGAVLAGADEDAQTALAEFGRLVGIAFQLGDDLLGVFGSVGETGKSNVSDLREGKETSLIAYARGTSRWGAFAETLGRDDVTVTEARRLATALEECGARTYVEELLVQHVDRAVAVLNSPAIPSRLADLLTDVARSCVGRIA